MKRATIAIPPEATRRVAQQFFEEIASACEPPNDVAVDDLFFAAVNEQLLRNSVDAKTFEHTPPYVRDIFARLANEPAAHQIVADVVQRQLADAQQQAPDVVADVLERIHRG